MRYVNRAGLLFCLSPLLIGCGAKHRLPSKDPTTIDTLVVKPFDVPGKSDDRLVVAAADYAEILKLFDDGIVDRHPAKWVVIGQIEITYKDGQTCSIVLFLSQSGPGAYRIGETYYRGATDELFRSTIRKCRERAKTVQE